MRLHKRNLVGLLIIVFLVFGAALTAWFASQKGTKFDTRQRASGPSGTATITLETTTSTRYVGDVFPVRVMLNTNGKPISAAALQLKYPITYVSGTTTPDLAVVDQDPNAAGTQIISNASTLASSFSTSINLATENVTNNTRYIYIDFSAIDTSITGYTNNTPELLATIYLKVNAISASKTIDHDAAQSRVLEKSATAPDILQTIVPLTLQLQADTIAPAVSITSGLAEAAISTQAAQTFTWVASDSPTRPLETLQTIKYQYTWDSTTVPTVSSFTETLLSATRTFTHGAHTLRVWARDFVGNQSAALVRTFSIDLTPKITSITPDTGPFGTQIIIRGYNFTTHSTTRSIVFGTTSIGSTSTNVASWTDNQIVVTIPSNANGTTIKVVVGSLTSNSFNFNYETLLKVVYKAQGLIQNRGAQPVTVVIKKASDASYTQQFANVSATWDATENAYVANVGPITWPSTLTSNSASDFTVSIDDPVRLRKKFTGVTLTKSNRNVLVKKTDLDAMKAADFNNNNILSIDDFGLILGQITQLVVPVTATNAKFDLNKDQVIDVTDVALLLANYKALENPGDNE